MGEYNATPAQLDYKWEGKALRIRDLGDGTLSVTTPAVSDRVVSKSLVLAIDSDGNLSTRPITATKEQP
ncbi:hypothetical protein [Luteolibacter arcticus]|nr:hypothetical protein [Luteolibacter arcticus]